jgi:hypothetical protein
MDSAEMVTRVPTESQSDDLKHFLNFTLYPSVIFPVTLCHPFQIWGNKDYMVPVKPHTPIHSRSMTCFFTAAAFV